MVFNESSESSSEIISEQYRKEAEDQVGGEMEIVELHCVCGTGNGAGSPLGVVGYENTM